MHPVFPQAINGFTLIELLVVVLIIGILASVALPYYKNAVAMARATQLQTAVASVVKGQEMFYMNHNRYTGYISALPIDFNQFKQKETSHFHQPGLSRSGGNGVRHERLVRLYV